MLNGFRTSLAGNGHDGCHGARRRANLEFQGRSEAERPTLLGLLGGWRRTTTNCLDLALQGPCEPHSLCIVEHKLLSPAALFVPHPHESSHLLAQCYLGSVQSLRTLGLPLSGRGTLRGRTHSLLSKGPSKFDFPSTGDGFPHIRRT